MVKNFLPDTVIVWYSPCSCSSYASCEKLDMENSILRSCGIANIEIVLPLLISKQWNGFFFVCVCVGWTIAYKMVNGSNWFFQLIYSMLTFNYTWKSSHIQSEEQTYTCMSFSFSKNTTTHTIAMKMQRSAKMGALNGTCFTKPKIYHHENRTSYTQQSEKNGERKIKWAA